jgi:hypothetical protein
MQLSAVRAISPLAPARQPGRRHRPACPAASATATSKRLPLVSSLADEIDTAIAEAVKGLRASGYSWAEIGARLGITRQAAQQRWGTSS